jgi:sodium transport system permease protein
VVQKEMRETVRDRRTLLIMIVVPVLLYPAIMILSQQLSLFGRRQLERAPARVAVVADARVDALSAYLAGQEDLTLVDVEDPEAAIRAGYADAVAVVDNSPGTDGTQRIEVLYDGANDRSQRARGVLVSVLVDWGDELLSERLVAQGLPETFARPLELESTSVARPEELGGYALGRFLPMILILITLLGVFYPAIDLAAGEKERGTLETLLTAPTHARQIVAGKFITVTIIGVVAAGLNLSSMLLTFQSGLFQIQGAVEVEFSIPLRSILIIFATLVPLAILFGAMFLGIAVRSRSFKEAQNALTPFYMAVMIPSLLPLFPGIEYTAAISVVPVAGVALLFRELMGGNLPLTLATLTLLSSLVYAMLALLFAADAFGREDVLFGGDDKTPGGELGWVRRLLSPSGAQLDVPTPMQTMVFVAGVALLFFYFGLALQTRLGERGLLASEWIILLGSASAFVTSTAGPGTPGRGSPDPGGNADGLVPGLAPGVHPADSVGPGRRHERLHHRRRPGSGGVAVLARGGHSGDLRRSGVPGRALQRHGGAHVPHAGDPAQRRDLRGVPPVVRDGVPVRAHGVAGHSTGLRRLADPVDLHQRAHAPDQQRQHRAPGGLADPPGTLRGPRHAAASLAAAHRHRSHGGGNPDPGSGRLGSGRPGPAPRSRVHRRRGRSSGRGGAPAAVGADVRHLGHCSSGVRG